MTALNARRFSSVVCRCHGNTLETSDGGRQENQRLLDMFGKSLSALGWTDGKDIAVLARWADDRTEALPAITKELIGSGVAVLITAGTPATVAAKRASASLPIVLVAVDDPVSLRIVESLGQPGGNATGLRQTPARLCERDHDLFPMRDGRR